jgi:superfamily II DNA or RNA helicase
VTPNEAQKEALKNLALLRDKGFNRATVIAATGVGKTYLAAFDFMQTQSRSLLFIAHRENILQAALRSFRNALMDSKFGILVRGGNHVQKETGSVFAMIQTISRDEHLSRLSPDAFDYTLLG